MKNKVSEIEFRISYGEIDDGILRAAELIKEGYTIYSLGYDNLEYEVNDTVKSVIYLTFRKGYYE